MRLRSRATSDLDELMRLLRQKHFIPS